MVRVRVTHRVSKLIHIKVVTARKNVRGKLLIAVFSVAIKHANTETSVLSKAKMTEYDLCFV